MLAFQRDTYIYQHFTSNLISDEATRGVIYTQLLAMDRYVISHLIKVEKQDKMHFTQALGPGPIAHTRCLISHFGKNYTQDVLFHTSHSLMKYYCLFGASICQGNVMSQILKSTHLR